MDYSFDCTQIVTVKRVEGRTDHDEVCKTLTKIWGNAVLTGNQIQVEKSQYVSLFSKSTVDIFEFKDEEFQGEFEDWKNVEDIPERIMVFESCIAKLIEYDYDVEKVFVIQTPSEESARIHETSIEPLSVALYRKSMFYTEEGAGCEVLIVNLDR